MHAFGGLPMGNAPRARTMTSIAKHVPVSVRLRLELASVSLHSGGSQHWHGYIGELQGCLLACLHGCKMYYLRSWDSRLSALRSFCSWSAQMSYMGEALSTCQCSDL